MLKTEVNDTSREGENARLPAMTAMLIPGLERHPELPKWDLLIRSASAL